MEHSKHLIRAFLLIVLIFSSFEIFRQYMRPKSFGELGHFRADAIQEAAAQEFVFGDSRNCASCHESEAKAVLASKHNSINCQLCHAPLSLHAENGERINDMPVDRNKSLCLRCHEQLVARPSGLRQINLSQHITEQEIENIDADGVCLDCHSSHEPDL